MLPGLAVSTVLRSRGYGVRLWLAGRPVEDRLVAEWSGEVCRIRSSGLPTGSAMGRLLALPGYVRTAFACRRAMRGSVPDALLAMGGYASVGPVLAARMLRRPVVLHEGNAIPGRAVQALARLADTIALAFEEAGAHLRHPRVVLTGFPLRHDIEAAAAARRAGTRRKPVNEAWSPDVTTVLVLGGSQGASSLNDRVSSGIAAFTRSGRAVQVIHLAGKTDVEAVRQTYAAANVPHDVRPFMEDIWNAYAASDLVVARSGGSTCAEIRAFGLPSILIPLPCAARDHQHANARMMARSGRVEILPEDALENDSLPDCLGRILDGTAADAEPGRECVGAAEAVADLIEKMVAR